jgi:hypothetical protein
MRWIVGLLFLAMAAWTLIPDRANEGALQEPRSGVLVATMYFAGYAHRLAWFLRRQGEVLGTDMSKVLPRDVRPGHRFEALIPVTDNERALGKRYKHARLVVRFTGVPTGVPMWLAAMNVGPINRLSLAVGSRAGYRTAAFRSASTTRFRLPCREPIPLRGSPPAACSCCANDAELKHRNTGSRRG